MLNPQDLDSILVHSRAKPGAIYVQMLEMEDAVTICEPLMPLQLAIHRMTRGEEDVLVIKKNGGPIKRELGEVHPIWVARYKAVSLITHPILEEYSDSDVHDQHETIVVIYEDDLNTVGIDDDYTNVE